jgi:hypothetical protein
MNRYRLSAVLTVLAGALVLACGSGGGTSDPGATPDAPDVAAPVDVPDGGPSDAPAEEASAPADPGPDPVADVPEDAAEAGGDAAPDVAADVAVEVDAGPLPVWEDLAGTGRTLGNLVGVASHMTAEVGEDADRAFELAQYKALDGFRIRRGLRWNNVQPTKDEWKLEKVSGAVDLSVANGVEILPLLAYGVKWAETDGTYGSVDITAYAAYAGGMAKAFCDRVKEYEIWNEQNISRFWDPAPDPAKYADMLALSYDAIKAECPDARVSFGGMASWDDVTLFDRWAFLREALEARPDLCGKFDILALHPYTWFQFDPPERDAMLAEGVYTEGQTWMTEIARAILAGAGCGDKPIYFTELGWPSYELTREQVARYAARSLLIAARDGVDGWYWYTFYDDDPDSDAVRPHENHFGLFEWPGADGTNRTPKPAWKALVALHDRLDHHRFARDLGPALGLPNDVYAYVFVDGTGARTVAAWDGREYPDTIPGSDTDAGGPDTTYALDLPLPDCATATRLYDQYGVEQASPGAGPSVALTLSPAVQYVEIECP